jgi:hypothetical protein
MNKHYIAHTLLVYIIYSLWGISHCNFFFEIEGKFIRLEGYQVCFRRIKNDVKNPRGDFDRNFVSET